MAAETWVWRAVVEEAVAAWAEEVSAQERSEPADKVHTNAAGEVDNAEAIERVVVAHRSEAVGRPYPTRRADATHVQRPRAVALQFAGGAVRPRAKSAAKWRGPRCRHARLPQCNAAARRRAPVRDDGIDEGAEDEGVADVGFEGAALRDSACKRERKTGRWPLFAD